MYRYNALQYTIPKELNHYIVHKFKFQQIKNNKINGVNNINRMATDKIFLDIFEYSIQLNFNRTNLNSYNQI